MDMGTEDGAARWVVAGSLGSAKFSEQSAQPTRGTTEGTHPAGFVRAVNAGVGAR